MIQKAKLLIGFGNQGCFGFLRSLESYFSEYIESHRNPLNIKIHNNCMPARSFVFANWSALGDRKSVSEVNWFKFAEIKLQSADLLGLVLALVSGYLNKGVKMTLKKLLLVSLIFIPSLTLADGPMCEVTDKSGTIDVSNCPGDRPWRCYENVTCEDGRTYTEWGSCQEGIQYCW